MRTRNKQLNRFSRLLKQFEVDHADHVLVGSYHPDHWDALELNFKIAKKRLINHFKICAKK